MKDLKHDYYSKFYQKDSRLARVEKMLRKVELKLNDSRTEGTRKLTRQVFNAARATDYLSCRFGVRNRERTPTLFADNACGKHVMQGSDC